MPTCTLCSSTNIAAKGLCWTHYQRKRRTGSTDSPPRGPRVSTCIHCPSTDIAAKGMCWKHYQSQRRTGQACFDNRYPLGPPHPKKMVNGYWRFGRKFLHRVMFELAHGRDGHECVSCGCALVWRENRRRSEPWGDTLVVHHVDGDRDNNSPANLAPSCAYCNSGDHVATAPAYTQRDTCRAGHFLRGTNVTLRNGYMQCCRCIRLRASARD